MARTWSPSAVSLLRVYRARAQGGCGHNRCSWVWQGGPALTLPSGEDVGQWPVPQGPRTQPHRGEEGCWPWGLPSDRSGEQGPRGGGPAENRARAVWLGTSGYFKQHTGEICVTLEMGWMQGSAAAEHLCSERGLYRVWAGAAKGRDSTWGSAWGGEGGYGCPGWAALWALPLGAPAPRRNLPPQRILGSLSQPLPSMTGECAEGVMGVCNPFTSLVLDIYSL